jgi:PAS domain S-box-containing protein
MFGFRKAKNKSLPESKNAEQDTKTDFEKAMLRAISSAMPDPYYARDMDYNIILWPDSIAKVMGYTEAEAKKLKCYDLFKAVVCPPNADCPTAGCIVTKNFLRDVAVDVYHKNGSTIHALVSNAGIYDDDGNPIGAVEVVKNNTTIQSIMSSIEQSIKDIDTVAAAVNSAIGRMNTLSNKINEMARESLDNVKGGVQAGNIVNEKIKHSNKHAGDVQTNMTAINESMKSSIEKIITLKEKSESIIQFVDVIKSIATQTNLLAINASIEAAHAGEHGKGFMVVAGGVRELSEDSSKSARSIEDLITEINTLVLSTTDSLNLTEGNVKAGAKRINELLDIIEGIESAMKTLSDTISSTEKAAAATANLDREQVASTANLTESGRDLTGIAEKLTRDFDRIFKALKREDMG